MTDGPWQKLAKKFGRGGGDTVAVLRLEGAIGSAASLGKPGLTIDSVESTLKRAFTIDGVSAVALVINSPGGSPAQSECIASRIRQLSTEKGVPVLAFCEDIAASGGYWIACAADEIFAAHTSLVGSIGVVSSGFGFSDVIDRFGVQRRVYTSGENKARLDAFSPENADDVVWLKGLQGQLHSEFIGWVKQRRGKKLAATDGELFNGDVWSGSAARDVGLVDGVGVLRSVLAERFPDADIVKVEAPKPLLARVLGGQVSMSGIAEDVVGGAVFALSKAQEIRFR